MVRLIRDYVLRFGRLVLEVANDGTWQVHEPFQVQRGKRIETIWPGFKTDLASVPRTARPIVRTWGRWTKPAVYHDHLYRQKLLPRAECDRRFLEGMKAEGVSWPMRYAMYASVRAFGWLTY